MSRSLAEILLEAAEKRRAMAGPETTAYRLLNAEADGVPGVTIDWFDGVAVANLYDAPSMTSRLADALEASLHPVALYIKRRPRDAARLSEADRRTAAPIAPILGEPIGERIVTENGLRFAIRPAQGLAVGLYLDMRDTRAWVRHQAKGKRVLNCFAYTCGFAVAALAGGAERVINVDLSRSSLEWGSENSRLNGQRVSREDYLPGEVFDWLARFERKAQRFEMVILDPPSFATARQRSFSAARDWASLIERACGVLQPGGVLVACCNQLSLTRPRFERLVTRGFANSRRRARVIARLGPPGIDFPVAPGKTAGLKVLAYEVR